MLLLDRNLIDLRRRLKRRGITQEDVAQAAAVSRPYVCLVLRGRRQGPRVIAMIHQMLEEPSDGPTNL